MGGLPGCLTLPISSNLNRVHFMIPINNQGLLGHINTVPDYPLMGYNYNI